MCWFELNLLSTEAGISYNWIQQFWAHTEPETGIGKQMETPIYIFFRNLIFSWNVAWILCLMCYKITNLESASCERTLAVQPSQFQLWRKIGHWMSLMRQQLLPAKQIANHERISLYVSCFLDSGLRLLLVEFLHAAPIALLAPVRRAEIRSIQRKSTTNKAWAQKSSTAWIPTDNTSENTAAGIPTWFRVEMWNREQCDLLMTHNVGSALVHF